VLVGLVVLLGIVYSGIVVARFERWRLRLVDADPAPNPHRPVARWRDWPLARLRELALMAEGRSNAAIARALVVSDAAVAKHIANILTKLDLPPAPDDHRRVLAVLAYLRG
jgi:DNA-binding NarL/FixJ family response regulator